MNQESKKFSYDKSAVCPIDRGVALYKRFLGLRKEDLENKDILDIGAGLARFQQEAGKPGTKIISIDPMYRYLTEDAEKMLGKEEEKDDTKVSGRTSVLRFRDDFVKKGRTRKNKAAAINEALPFLDESFDLCLANFSSFYWADYQYPDNAERKVMVQEMVKEILRVLRPGGEARVNMDWWLEDEYKDILKGMETELLFSWEIKRRENLRILILRKKEAFEELSFGEK
ncbi:MAG: class I SAM-dependent methyltransferase [Patescibacteria group bacterium]|nr:class I SAM-dependent methyltransferase [Patescibacteria group bacterium]